MACGVSIMFIIGPVLYWRLLALIGMAPCLLQLLGLFFVPESPRWLANMGRRKEAEGALQRLWGRNADISKEAAEIEVRHNRSCNVVDTWFLVFVCQIFRPRFQCDMQDLHRWSNAIPTLAFLGETAYGGSYSLGLGGIPWVMMSEIFPVNLMGSASSIVNLVSWGGSWVVAYTFNGFFLWSSAGH
ncbi:hypothetical protein CRG98_005581 [Punica granatum]|uniref:Major facilitator superfamily (MFS) profile domain-containing protein n=1 Tax=Punica granatum TaxID=22663 RepID=A0A2I0L0H3_PUNGR|nr:hypothetical protein CRG98_005581 [Punica granatum]